VKLNDHTLDCAGMWVRYGRNQAKVEPTLMDRIVQSADPRSGAPSSRQKRSDAVTHNGVEGRSSKENEAGWARRPSRLRPGHRTPVIGDD
jgi:hypothetical protein